MSELKNISSLTVQTNGTLMKVDQLKSLLQVAMDRKQSPVVRLKGIVTLARQAVLHQTEHLLKRTTSSRKAINAVRIHQLWKD